MSVFSPLIQEKLNVLPDSSGVYTMVDIQGRILYIGKAKNLKSRVRSYFGKHQDRILIQHMIPKVHDIQLIITNNEKEALILEDTLIKKHQPPYNINLKDNKTYPYLKLIEDKQYPQLIKTRTLKKDKHSYFGPYTDVKQLYGHLETLNDLFPLKKCHTRHFPKGFKPCLYHHMNKCLPYCTHLVDENVVVEMLNKVKQILKGKNEDIIELLEQGMKEYSVKQEYEMALKFKKHIEKLKYQIESQLINLLDRKNFDVINYFISHEHITFVVLSFEDGRLNNKYSFHQSNEALQQNEQDEDYIKTLLSNFIMQYYSTSTHLISDLIIPIELEDIYELIQVIEQKMYENLHEKIRKDLRLSFIAPKTGKNKRLLHLASLNAKLSFEELQRSKEKEQKTVELKKVLKLSKLPLVIESFDIANTGDKAIMAGMVRYVDGKKDKEGYRLFNIKSTDSQNDFQSMYEAVYRRYKHVLTNNEPMPDLIIIDGGKGQLSSALKALLELKVIGQPIISLAKQEEEIYVPKKEEPIILPHSHPALAYLIDIRNETHRFINSKHRKKRDTTEISSFFMTIPGIAEKKRETLLKHFSSMKEILLSSEETLLSLPSFNSKDVQNIREYLKKHLDE